MIAGTVEYLAQKKKTTPPEWTEDSRRRCEGWYFSGISELEAIEKAESPEPFIKRGVYITEADLSLTSRFRESRYSKRFLKLSQA